MWHWSIFEKKFEEEQEEFDHMNYTRRDQVALKDKLTTTWLLLFGAKRKDIKGWWSLLISKLGTQKLVSKKKKYDICYVAHIVVKS